MAKNINELFQQATAIHPQLDWRLYKGFCYEMTRLNPEFSAPGRFGIPYLPVVVMDSSEEDLVPSTELELMRGAALLTAIYDEVPDFLPDVEAWSITFLIYLVKGTDTSVLREAPLNTPITYSFVQDILSKEDRKAVRRATRKLLDIWGYYTRNLLG